MIIKIAKFDISEIPRFICPKCNIGQLRLIKDSVMHKHPSWISMLPEVSEVTLDYSTGKEIHEVSKMQIVDEPGEEKITSFFLKCDREKCQEVVVTCGTTICELEQGPIQEGGYLNESYVDYYFPKYFYPSIRLFEVPERTPKDVVNELDLAFSLFWSNPAACGNSQRKVLERLIDNIKCDEFNDNDSLHKKINKLVKENPIYKLAMAVKWIGNDGSHESTLKHEDVILGFEFIQKCLFDLYQEKKDLESIALKINDSEDPISKIKD